MQTSDDRTPGRRGVVLAVAYLLLLQTWPLSAQAIQRDRKAVVADARAALDFRDNFQAMTSSRCKLTGIAGISFHLYVIQLSAAMSPWHLGDQIVSISGRRVEQKIGLMMLLEPIPPDAIVKVGVRRQGEGIEIDVQCHDSLPYYLLERTLLSAIAKKQFGVCLNRLGELEAAFGRSSETLSTLWNCTYHAGRFNSPRDSALVFYEYLRLLIDEDRWDPTLIAETRRIVVSNRSFFADADQSSLYLELEKQLAATEPLAVTQSPGSALSRLIY